MTVSTTSPLTENQAPQSLLTTAQSGSFLDSRAAKKQLQQYALFVSSEYKKCKDARSKVEKQWYLNLLFYYGRQYHQFIDNSSLPGNVNGKLILPKAPPWRTRLVSNKIRPIIRTELSRVTSQKPNASVVPASSDDQDLFAAQAGEQIWESFYQQEHVSTSFRRSMWWMLITGTGYLKSWWDPNAQDPLCVDPETGILVPGKICVAPVTPFHVFVPDLLEEELENQAYVINAYTRPVTWVKQFFGDSVQGNLEANIVSTNEILENQYLNLQGTTQANPDSVLCLEMWLKPGAHKDFPNGGMITMVSNTIVHIDQTGLPYDHKQYPFIKFDHIPSGKFYADSVIVDLVSLQREYNRTNSQIVEAKNRMAKPQIMAPKGSIDPKKITSEPGQVIEYRPGLAPPQPLPLQDLPAYVSQTLDRVSSDMEDISSQHSISRGQAPAGVTAATAISYLQEQDDSPLTHTFQSIEEGFQKLGTQVLSYVVQYWDTEHMVKVVGTDGAFDTMVLKGSSIASGTDIRMEPGSSLPISKAARQAFLMDLMKNGFIDPNKGLELMEIGGVQKLYDQLALDKRQAQRENLRLKSITSDDMDMYDAALQEQQQATDQAAVIAGPQGPDPSQQTDAPGQYPDTISSQGIPDPGQNPTQQMGAPSQPTTINPQITDPATDAESGQPLTIPFIVPVNTWDNHQTHIQTHNDFRKGQSFELLGPYAKRAFELHVQMHMAAANTAIMQSAMGQGTGITAPPDPSQTPGPQPGQGDNQFTTAQDPSQGMGGG